MVERIFESYCTFPFLANFDALKNQEVDLANLTKEDYLWASFKKFLFSDSRVFLKMPTNDVFDSNAQSPIVFELLNILFGEDEDKNQWVQILEDFEKVIEEEKIHDKGSPYKYFFLEKEFEVSLNAPIIHSEEVYKHWKFLSQSPSFIVDKRNHERDNEKYIKLPGYKSALRDYCYPINSIVIVDNYLFAFERNGRHKEKVENNVIPLLEALLLKSNTKSIIQILIICHQYYEPINQVHNFLRERFKDKFRDLDIKLTLVECEVNENHDRHIYTNLFTLKSGNTFSNYFDSKGKIKLTSITDFEVKGHPAKCDNAPNQLSYYQSHLKVVRDIVIKDKNRRVGQPKNRLLEFAAKL